MNKGCVIAAVIVGVIVVVCAGVMVFFGMRYANPSVIFVFESAISEYQKAHPDAVVEPTNEAWVQTLTAADSGVEPKLLDAIKQSAARGNGKFVDMYGIPVNVEPQADGEIRVLSAGKDGQFGTKDDENTDKLRAMIPQETVK